MMSNEQARIVRMVYNRFMENESDDWTTMDDNLEIFSWLSNEDLVRESKAKFKKHSKGTFRCGQTHDQSVCFAPHILESVEAILDLYKSTKELHLKNAYILSYYLVLSELKLIYSD